MASVSYLAIAALSLQRTSAIRVSRHQSEGYSIAGVPVRGVAPASAESADWISFFKKGVTNAELEAFCAAQAGGCRWMGHPDQGGLPMVTMHGKAADLETSVRRVSSQMESLVPDIKVEDDPELPEPTGIMASVEKPWGLERIGVPSASTTGKGVHVYVLDSGIRVSHVDFGGRAIPTLDFGTVPATVCDPTDQTCAADDRGHGSHCAGTVGGKTYGVAPDSTLHAMDRGASYGDAYGSLDWLIQNAQYPSVVTMSFGGYGLQEGAEVTIDSVVAAGITVVTSGGNNNDDACLKTWAFIPSAIAVGSTVSDDSRSWFSNYGTCIGIFAPGSRTLSCDYKSDEGTSVKSGTSMAAPHAAGAAALILEASPNFTPAQVRETMLANAEQGALSDVKGSPNLLLHVV